MKKIMIFVLMLAASAPAQTLVFTNQTITVKPSQLTLDAVRYVPETVVTNTMQEWDEVEQITTNGMFSGGTIETNTVSVQQLETTVTTNAAHWVADVKFILPRGYEWNLNGIPVEIERFSTRLEIHIEPAAVQAVFGASYPALLFAVQTGNYQPTGQVRDGFLFIAAGVLAAGQ